MISITVKIVAVVKAVFVTSNGINGNNRKFVKINISEWILCFPEKSPATKKYKKLKMIKMI
jgi:hypothetical protein